MTRGSVYAKLLSQGNNKGQRGGDNLSTFEKQLLGYWDKTPEFFADYERIFGEAYTYTKR